MLCVIVNKEGKFLSFKTSSRSSHITLEDKITQNAIVTVSQANIDYVKKYIVGYEDRSTQGKNNILAQVIANGAKGPSMQCQEFLQQEAHGLRLLRLSITTEDFYEEN